MRHPFVDIPAKTKNNYNLQRLQWKKITPLSCWVIECIFLQKTRFWPNFNLKNCLYCTMHNLFIIKSWSMLSITAIGWQRRKMHFKENKNSKKIIVLLWILNAFHWYVTGSENCHRAHSRCRLNDSNRQINFSLNIKTDAIFNCSFDVFLSWYSPNWRHS